MSNNYFALVEGVLMTTRQHAILSELRTAHEQGYGLISLTLNPKTDTRTIRLLRERDWIVESWKVFNEPRFSITSRGLKALVFAEGPAKRHRAGDMCFKCGKAPREVYPSGQRSPYCKTHRNAYNRARYAKHGHGYNPNLVCGRCRQNPRAIAPTGRVYGHCMACKKITATASKQKRVIRTQAALSQGASILCKRCMDAPIHVTPSVVNATCKSCTNILRRQRTRQFQRRRMAEKLGFKQGAKTS